MKIDRKADGVYFRFEPKEWAINDGQTVRDFQSEFKNLVDPKYRDFNELNKEWWVTNEGAWVLDKLREKYFKDPNQMDLFGE